MADFGSRGERPAGIVAGETGGRRRKAALAAVMLVASFLAAEPARAADPTPSVVVSIKPIHSLAMSLMEGIDVPMLLVEGAASPHAWTLKPSQAAALSEADLVIWIGEGLESFLAAPMASLVPEGHGLELADLPEIELLPLRAGGVWQAHGHGDDDHIDEDHADETQDEAAHGDDDDHAGYDAHLWLDPLNAIAIARAVAARLAEIDPSHADAYAANLAALLDRLTRLDAETRARLDPVRDVPFIVFHDAYQYFEWRYGLAAAGSLALDPEQPPSAARLAEIRDRLVAGDVACAFAEPLFDTSLLDTAVEDTDVRIAALDPEGVDLAPGPDLYFELIGNLAETMAACLAAQS